MPAYPIVESAVFDGKTASTDGRFRAVNGRLCHHANEGRHQQLNTIQTSRRLRLNSIFATPNTDSGVFNRVVSCSAATTCSPAHIKNLKNYKPQDWNELVIAVAMACCTMVKC